MVDRNNMNHRKFPNSILGKAKNVDLSCQHGSELLTRNKMYPVEFHLISCPLSSSHSYSRSQALCETLSLYYCI